MPGITVLAVLLILNSAIQRTQPILRIWVVGGQEDVH